MLSASTPVAAISLSLGSRASRTRPRATCSTIRIAVYPIAHYYVARQPPSAGLLLGYATVSVAQIRLALAQLERAWKPLL